MAAKCCPLLGDGGMAGESLWVVAAKKSLRRSPSLE